MAEAAMAEAAMAGAAMVVVVVAAVVAAVVAEAAMVVVAVVAAAAVAAAAVVATTLTFWIVLKQNVMNSRVMPAQTNNLINTTLIAKNADPRILNILKMLDSAELNIWINLEQNSCLDVVQQTRVQN